MRYQLALSAAIAAMFPRVLSAPLRARGADVVTVTGQVTEVVAITSTVWASPVVVTETKAADRSHEDIDEKQQLYRGPTAAPTPSSAQSSAYKAAPTPPPVAPSPPAPPKPSSTYVPPAPASKAPESAPVSEGTSGGGGGGGSGSSGRFSGEGTFFTPAMGACGETNSESDYIVAVSQKLFDETKTPDPNQNPICGKKMTIFGPGGKKATARVVDRCVGCAYHDVDMTPSVFEACGWKQDEGRVRISWAWA